MRCAVPVAERQATERTRALFRLTTFGPPAGRGRGWPSGPSLPRGSVRMRPVVFDVSRRARVRREGAPNNSIAWSRLGGRKKDFLP